MSLSHTIKTIATGVPTLFTGGVPGARAGDERLTSHQPQFATDATFDVTSSAFEADGELPMRFSTDGQDISPPLAWSNLPADTKSVVLMVEDPDAPLPNPFVHWLAWNLNPTTTSLPEGVAKDSPLMVQGKNSGLKPGWTGMAPPKGDLPHRYFFQMFALNDAIELPAGSGRGALVKAMEGKILAKGQTIGTFQR